MFWLMYWLVLLVVMGVTFTLLITSYQCGGA